MADLELVDALTDSPPQIEPEVKRDFISSLEAEPYDDVIGEKCDKTDYVPLLDDDEANGSDNKHSAEGSHPSVLENGEHNTGDVGVSDPFGITGNEHILADLLLPPQVQICPAFTAQVPESSVGFDEGWLTDSCSKSGDTDTQSADASEKTTATYGETPSDDSSNLPFQVQQSDPNSHIWQPTAEEQIALSFHNAPELEGHQQTFEDSPFDAPLSTESQLLPRFGTPYLEEPDTDLLKPDFYNQDITSAYIENPDSTTENYVHDSLNNLAVAEDRLDEAACNLQSVESGQPKEDIATEQVTPASQSSVEPPQSPAVLVLAEPLLKPVAFIRENSLVEQFPADILSFDFAQDVTSPVSPATLNQETGSPASPAKLVQVAETLTSPIALLQEAEAPTSPVALGQEGEALASPVALGQEGEVSASPVVLGQEGEVSASPVALGQEGEVSAFPVALGQEGEVSAFPVALAQEGEVSAFPVALAQEGEVSASPVALAQEGEASASPVALAQIGEASASLVALVQEGEASASPVALVQETEATVFHVALDQKQEVPASSVALTQEAVSPAPPAALVHDLESPASPVALVQDVDVTASLTELSQKLESPVEALIPSVIEGNQPPEGPPEQFGTPLGRDDLQHPGDQVPLKQSSYKTSDRRLGRAKTALAPISDTFLELGSPSPDSPPSQPAYSESLSSRAKALHKKAHDMMESRREAARDVGDPEGVQTFIKKKKKKTKPRKPFVPKELEIGEDDAFTRAGSEPFYTSAGQMGDMDTPARQDHVFEQPLDSAANGTVPASNLTVAERTLECYVEREGDLTLFSQEKLMPAPQKIDSPSIKHFATPPGKQEDKSLFDLPSLMGESGKSDAPMESIFGTADTDVTKCPYLHPEILLSTSHKASSKRDEVKESGLEKIQSTNKHLANAFPGDTAETVKWDKPKKRDKRAGNYSRGGHSKDPKHWLTGLDNLELDAQAGGFPVALPLNPEREALQEEKHSPLVIPQDKLQKCKEREHKPKSNNVSKNLCSDSTEPPSVDFGHGLDFRNVTGDLLVSEEKTTGLEKDLHGKAFDERDILTSAIQLPASRQVSAGFGEGMPKEDIPCTPLTLTDTVVGLVLGSIEPQLNLTIVENEPIAVPKKTAPILRTDQILDRKESVVEAKPGVADDGKQPVQKSKPVIDLCFKESLLENKADTGLIVEEQFPESKPSPVLASKEPVCDSKPIVVLGSKEAILHSKPSAVLSSKEPVTDSKPSAGLGGKTILDSKPSAVLAGSKEPVTDSKPTAVLGSKEAISTSKPSTVLGSKEPVPESKPSAVLDGKEPVPESKPSAVLDGKEPVLESKLSAVLGGKEAILDRKSSGVLSSKEPVADSKPSAVLGGKPILDSKPSAVLAGSKEPVTDSKPSAILGSKEPVAESKPSAVLGGKEPVPESKPSAVLGGKAPVPESKPSAVLGGKEPVLESKPSAVLGGREPVLESKPSAVLGGKEPVLESKPSVVLGGKEPVPESNPSAVLGGKAPVPESKPSAVLGGKAPVPESKPSAVLGGRAPVLESKPSAVLGGKEPVLESKPSAVLGGKEPVLESKPSAVLGGKESVPESKPSAVLGGKEPVPESKPGTVLSSRTLDTVLGISEPILESKPETVLCSKESIPENKPVTILDCKVSSPETKPDTCMEKELVQEYMSGTVPAGKEPLPEGKPDTVLGLKSPASENRPHMESKPAAVIGSKEATPKSGIVPKNKKLTRENKHNKVQDRNETVPEDKPDKVLGLKTPAPENKPVTVLGDRGALPETKSAAVLDNEVLAPEWKHIFPDDKERLQESKCATSLNDKVLVEENKPFKVIEGKMPILEDVPHTVLDNKEPFPSKPATGPVLENQPSTVLKSELFPEHGFSSPAMVSQSEAIVQAGQLLSSSREVQNDGNVAFDKQVKSKRGKVKSKPNGAKSLHDAGDRGLEVSAACLPQNDQPMEANSSSSKKAERGSLKRPHSSEKNKSLVLTEAGPLSAKDHLTRNDHLEDSRSDPMVPPLPLLDVTAKEQAVKELLQGLDPFEADFDFPPCNVKNDQPEQQTMRFPSFLKGPSDVLIPTGVTLQGEMELKSSEAGLLDKTLEPNINLDPHLAKSLETGHVHGAENRVLVEKGSGLPVPKAEEIRFGKTSDFLLTEKLQSEVSGPTGLLDYNFNVQEGTFDFTKPTFDAVSEATVRNEFPKNAVNLSKDVLGSDRKSSHMEDGCDAAERQDEAKTSPAAPKASTTKDASKAKTKTPPSFHLKEQRPLMEKTPQKNNQAEEKTKTPDLKGYMRPTKARGAAPAPPLSRSAGLATVKPKQPKEPSLRLEKDLTRLAIQESKKAD